MSYKVEIADTESNNKFLKTLSKEIIPKLANHLKLLGENPHLGRSVEGPISAYIYSFLINHINKVLKFFVTYKVDENTEAIVITDFGKIEINIIDG